MHAAKCVLDLSRNDLADSLDFDMNLKTNPTDMILWMVGLVEWQCRLQWAEWWLRLRRLGCYYRLDPWCFSKLVEHLPLVSIKFSPSVIAVARHLWSWYFEQFQFVVVLLLTPFTLF